MSTSKNAVDNSWDVIVAGGGPAGCAAAVAAAREGAKTLLIESTGALGGMGTNGLLPFWTPFSDGEKIIARGIAEEVFNKSNECQDHISEGLNDWASIDTECLKVIYDEMIARHGVELQLFTSLIDTVSLEKGVVDHVVTSSKSGIRKYKAKVYIDCTGDGDLAVQAGAEYEKGDAKGNLQPATVCFQLSNVDTYAYLYTKKPEDNDPEIKKIVNDPKYPLIKSTHLSCTHLISPGVVGLNAGHIWNVDGTNAKSLSHAAVYGRKLAFQIKEALSEYYPEAFANAHLTVTSNLVGIRETRRIIGDYILTLEDYLERKKFSDEICRNAYPVDVHESEEEIEDVVNGRLVNDRRYELYAPGESYGIPYRCLIPKKLNNVLVAGRSISTDRDINGSTRIMPVSLVVGEAAGIAAYLAIAKGASDVRSVDTVNLRNKLKSYGGYLPDA